jgi:Spy/CpxP family protein refolding chaperone
MRFLTILLTALTFAFAPAMAQDAPSADQRPDPIEMATQQMDKNLDLSNRQADEVRNIFTEQVEKRQEILRNVDENTDRQQVIEDMRNLRQNTTDQLNEVLDAEQQATFEENRQKARERIQKRRQQMQQRRQKMRQQNQ